MDRSSCFARVAALSLLAVSVFLSGCSVDSSFPDSPDLSSTPAQIPLGTIKGNDYGGHAPIVGAHVFVLQAGTGGYGSKVTSLLNSSYANGSFPTAQDNITGSPTNGMYYVTTDAYSNFQLSGDYTCAAGFPVYLYASGGNPQTLQVVNITGATGTVDSNGKLLVTFSTTGTQLLYQGESITFSAFNPSTTAYQGFAGTTQVVSPINLATNQFAVELGASSNGVAQASFTGTVSQAVTTINPAIVNMAMLGVCPSTTTGTAITLTGATSSQSNGDLLVTFTNSGTNGLQAGEQVTFGTIPSPYNPFSGTTQTVSSLNLSSSQFAVLLGAGSNQTNATFSSTATPVSGNFSSLRFVFMNEVSTEALAVAMAPFTSVSSTQNDAVHIGTSSTNLIGLQNAANNAAELYDIQGSQVGAGGDGDTHIAYATTPGIVFFGTTTAGSATITNVSSVANMKVGYTVTGPYLPSGEKIVSLTTSPNTITITTGTGVTSASSTQMSAGGGFGTVPQTLLNTLGNVLANCVDSANTYNAAESIYSSGTASTQCSTLFTNATSDGTTSGAKPNDTATAAINIARYPGGTTSNTSEVSNIYNSISGNVPFQPNLSTAPHDFAVGVTYLTPGGATAISDTEVDGSGNIWTVGNGSNKVYELLPTGVFNTYSPPNGSTVTNAFQAGVAIAPDSSAVYVPAGAGMLKFVPGTFTGTLVTASNNANAANIAIDGAGANLYVAAVNATTENLSQLTKESIAGVAAGGNFPVSGNACLYQLQYVILDDSNNIWTNNEYSNNNHVCRYTSTGTLSYSLDLPGTAFPASWGGAVDAGGNFWFSEKDNSIVYKIAAGTTGTYTGTSAGCPTGAGCTVATGGTINTPFSAAVDGANNVWITNSGTSPASVTEFSNSAVAITPTFLSGTGYGTNYLSLQVDQSGSLWGTSYTTNSMVQYIGVATPAAMPLSYARANSKLGAKP